MHKKVNEINNWKNMNNDNEVDLNLFYIMRNINWNTLLINK